MKVLNNPWVVGALAVAAVAVVGYQVFPARWRQVRTVERQPAATASTSPLETGAPLSVQAPPCPGPAALPAISIDCNYAQEHLAEWASAPRRDPFLLVQSVRSRSFSAITNSPVTHWKLKGIWRQTGGCLATINNRVYAEGDKLEGYTIHRIDADQVWLEGPSGTECLGFEKKETGKKETPRPRL
jgi:hypothetical protein